MSNCNHTLDIGAVTIAKLIGNSRATESQVKRCRFKCRDCGAYLRYLPPTNGILRTIHLISLPIGLLLAVPYFFLVIKLAYSDTISEKLAFCLIVLGGIVLAFGATYLSKLITALLIKRGRLGKLCAISEDESGRLESYEALIHSDERTASKGKERLIVCLVLIPISIGLALMLIFIK